ncbi:glycosyltransferase [Tsuneonella mangrovi]|uniref:glycosyltransferase n=1 Tax=Tsuneonella mangrovi TaxID=1982042 RepID=UPI001F0AC4CF|nr:glycosyltransferase [Tsuneonella mangrovi]
MSRIAAPAVLRAIRPFSEPRVAIVHYWLLTMRGGERVIDRMLGLYPGADLFCHVYDRERMSARIRNARVSTTFIAQLPFSKRLYQYYLPLMPMALEELDLSGYDLVISSESGPAKGVITDPGSTHVCYCHSPMRYLWDHYHGYKSAANPIARLAMPPLYHRMRKWDVTSSALVDGFAANSKFIQQRIRKVWRREADVIHPPVEVAQFEPTQEVGEEFLWVGQMVSYKRPDIAVDAFNANGLPLLMVGTGPMTKRLRAKAKPNIRFVERMDFASLRRTYAQARAFVMTAEEDFGITPVEAMAAGRPVIGFGRGGILDSVVDQSTGLFFDRQEPETLQAAIERFDAFEHHFDPADSVARARHFAPEVFDRKFREFVGGMLG